MPDTIPPSTFSTDPADGPQNTNATTDVPVNYEICDLSGFKVPAGTLRRTWDGLMVHPKFWYPRNPRDFARGHAEHPKGSPRPEQTDVFIADDDQVTREDL